MIKYVKKFKGGGGKMTKKMTKRAKKIDSLESNKTKLIQKVFNVETKLNKKAQKKAQQQENNKASGKKKKSWLSRKFASISKLFSGDSSTQLKRQKKRLVEKIKGISGEINYKEIKQTKKGLEMEKLDALRSGILEAEIKTVESQKAAADNAAHIKTLESKLGGLDEESKTDDGPEKY